MAELEGPTRDLSLSPTQEVKPEMSPPIGPSEIPLSEVGPSLKANNPNLSLSHSNTPNNCEQKTTPKPVQVENVNRGDSAAEQNRPLSTQD